jgi:surface antigen
VFTKRIELIARLSLLFFNSHKMLMHSRTTAGASAFHDYQPYGGRAMLIRVLLLLFVLNFLAEISVAMQPGWATAFPSLSEGDIEIMKETARVKMTDKPKGTILKWENPKSGSSGTITLLRLFEHQGLQCRALKHLIKPRHDVPWTIRNEICLDANGEWKWPRPPRKRK